MGPEESQNIRLGFFCCAEANVMILLERICGEGRELEGIVLSLFPPRVAAHPESHPVPATAGGHACLYAHQLSLQAHARSPNITMAASGAGK